MGGLDQTPVQLPWHGTVATGVLHDAVGQVEATAQLNVVEILAVSLDHLLDDGVELFTLLEMLFGHGENL